MATVNLSSIFLNDAADPSDYMAFDYAGDTYTVDPVLGGGVDTGYASGRVRSWSTEEDRTEVSGLQLHSTTDAQREWLRAHRGRTVWFRDHLGHKVPVVYRSTPVTASTLPVGSRAADIVVAPDFRYVTTSEAV